MDPSLMADAEAFRKRRAAVEILPPPKTMKLDPAEPTAEEIKLLLRGRVIELTERLSIEDRKLVQSTKIKAIDHLKRKWEPTPFEAMLELAKANLNEEQRELLRAELMDNPKVATPDHGESFIFLPKYAVRNETELLQELQNMYVAHKGGILLSDLQESFDGVTKAVEALEARKALFTVKTKGFSNQADQILHFRETKYFPPVDDELRNIWKSTEIGETIEVGALLEKDGLKGVNVVVDTTKKEDPKKKGRKKGVYSRSHLTNTHMKEDAAPTA